MLKPEFLDSLPEGMVELYSQAERDILADMARRISAYDYYIPAAEHQRQVLRQMGMSQREIVKMLSALTNKSQMELRRIMREAYQEALDSDKAYYRQYGYSVPDAVSASIQTAMRSGYDKTSRMVRNLTATTAEAGQEAFVEALDRAWMQVQTGAFDANTAIRYTIKQLSKDGLKVIRYPSGHKDHLEVAVRRAVITGVNQSVGRVQIEMAHEVGCDLVETTAHPGARPSHEVWQGQIFSLSGISEEFPPFSETGYGTGDGLLGWNCRHNFHPYAYGAPRTYTPEMLAEYRAKDYTYDGKQYTEYEASQIQRYHERQIRRWKRENTAMEAAGQDTAESAAKIKYWQDRQKSFVKQTGLKRQADREQIPGFGQKTLVSGGRSGIINLKRNANRKNANGGSFVSLRIPMQKREVKRIAKKYGIDMKGITVKIQRNAKLLSLPTTGMTDYKNIGRIDLLPNAFMDEEQLVRTLIHERCHVLQLKKHGARFAQDNLNQMEKQAYKFEDFWYRYLTQRR